MDMDIGKMMSKITEEIIIDSIVTKGTEIEVQVKIVVDPGPDIGISHEIIQTQEIDIVMVKTRAETDKGLILETGKMVEQGLDQAHR